MIIDQFSVNFSQSEGYRYLLGRGLREETIERFSLMYFDGERLYGHSSSLSSAWITQVKAIFDRSVDDSFIYRRRFRDSIVIPVFDVYGSFVGLSVRRLHYTTQKFDATSYQKGAHLYGLSVTYRDILSKDAVFVAEGFFDLLAMWQAGIRNVVASNGVNMSSQQILLCKRFTNNFTVILDPDRAGIQGGRDMQALIRKWSGKADLVRLDAQMDVDDYIQNFGAQRLLEYAENPRTLHTNTSNRTT